MTKGLWLFFAFYLLVCQPALIWRMWDNSNLYQLAWLNAGVFFIAWIISTMCRPVHKHKSRKEEIATINEGNKELVESTPSEEVLEMSEEEKSARQSHWKIWRRTCKGVPPVRRRSSDRSHKSPACSIWHPTSAYIQSCLSGSGPGQYCPCPSPPWRSRNPLPESAASPQTESSQGSWREAAPWRPPTAWSMAFSAACIRPFSYTFLSCAGSGADCAAKFSTTPL